MGKKKPKVKECLYCVSNETEIDSDNFIIVPLDTPIRVDLLFHRECREKLTDDEIVSFLQDNKELWYNRR